MHSRTIKQILICVVIVLLTGIVAILIKSFFFDDTKKAITPHEIKDKYEYNEFQLVNITTEILTQKYFYNYKDKLLSATDVAYELLSEDTKEKYKTYDEFKSYVDENLEELIVAYPVEYNVQKGASITKYIVVDQFDNKYTFYSKAVLFYTVDIGKANETPSIFE